MKIKNIKLNEYGCIRDKSIDFSDRISIIKGDNESGKSTMHQAMLALLFGYFNTGRKNSFKLSAKAMSFSGVMPTIEGTCRDSGGEYRVSRFFEGQSPKLNVTRGGIITQSENLPLNTLGGLSRSSYEGIYSLDIDQIVKLKDSWEREQDSILAGLLPDFLLPNDKIMDNLDKSIKEAWKGKTATKLTKAKEIDDKIAELKSSMQQAKENQSELRQIEEAEEETQNKISNCRVDEQRLTREGLELKRQLEFYEEYRNNTDALIKNSEVEKYEQVPKDITNYLNDLAQKAKRNKEKSEEIDGKIKRLNEVAAKYKTNDEDIDKFKDQVPKAESVAAHMEAIKVRIDRDDTKRREKKNKLMAKVKRMFTNAFAWDNFADVMKVDIADCLAVLERIESASNHKARVQEDAFEEMRDKGSAFFKGLDKIDISLLIAAIIGAVLILVPFGINRIVTMVIGALILLGAGIVFLRRPKSHYDLDDEYTKEINRLDDEIFKYSQMLKNKLNYDFIPLERRNRIDEALIESIAQLQDEYAEYSEIETEVQKDKDEYDKMEEAVSETAQNLLGISIDYKADTAAMRIRLDELIKLEQDAASAQREIDLLNDNLLEVKNDIIVLDDKAAEIQSAIYNMQGENIMEKAQSLQNMRVEYVTAKRQQSLQMKKYEDYEELKASAGKNIDAKVYEVNTKLNEARENLESIRALQNDLKEVKGELSQKKKYLTENSPLPAVIDGQIAELKKERARRIRLRDEYAIAYGIIQKSRDKFISERSPEFLDTAGEYLSVITDGKYSRIKLNDKGTSIVVEDNMRAFDFDSIDATISRGTREQIYLALRLAMLERFDPAGEKLPIVLDEALVNWDVERFTKLMKIIGDLSSERQVFMFTCHDYVVDIVNNAGAEFKLINI